jgi:threonine dehydratase
MPAPTPLELAPLSLAGHRPVFLKREDVHELGAFKWRGAERVVERYAAEDAPGVVTASTGNHGAATTWAANKVGLETTVYAPEETSRTKIERLVALGADVVQVGADVDDAKDAAREHAQRTRLPFFEDGAEPAQLDGYAAIGSEILDQLEEPPAAVVVPVGNGALLAGIGRALGERAPGVQRIGVVSEDAPVMALSWEARRPVASSRCATIADGLAVRVAIPLAVEWLNDAADAMLQVSERAIAASVVAFDDSGIRVEPAAAAALAALGQIDGEGPVVLVVTGRNVDDELLAHCRALAMSASP